MKYFRLISIIAMALSTLRNLFRLTEDDSISKFQDFYSIPSSKLFCMCFCITLPIIILIMKILLHI